MFHTSTAFLAPTTISTAAISTRTTNPIKTNDIHNDGRRYQKYSTSATALSAIVALPNPIGGMSLRSILQAGESVMDCTTAIPPVDYFLALIAAGCGVPLSEDALCIFAGSTLPVLPNTQARIILMLHLYAGVVMSDIVTFCIGRALRTKILHRFSKFVQIIKKEKEEEETCEIMEPISEQDNCNKRKRRRDILQRKIASAGDAIGFVTRLSFGMRAPMMLLAGFSNAVSLANFASGTLLGALVSLSLQLGVGYSLRMTAGGGLNYGVLGLMGLVAVGASWAAVLLRPSSSSSSSKQDENAVMMASSADVTALPLGNASAVVSTVAVED